MDDMENYKDYVEDYDIELRNGFEDGFEEDYSIGGDSLEEDGDYQQDFIQQEEYGEYTEDGPEFQTEMGAYGEGGRVVMKRTIDQFSDLLAEGGLSSLRQAIGREYKNPIERFSGTVDAISRNLEIDEAIIESVLLKIISLKNIQYTNPVGYIFGYIATNGGREMDKSSIQDIFKKLNLYNNITDAGMEPPDLIRYARFWINFRRQTDD